MNSCRDKDDPEITATTASKRMQQEIFSKSRPGNTLKNQVNITNIQIFVDLLRRNKSLSNSFHA